jgi:hypothetical protein
MSVSKYLEDCNKYLERLKVLRNILNNGRITLPKEINIKMHQDRNKYLYEMGYVFDQDNNKLSIKKEYIGTEHTVFITDKGNYSAHTHPLGKNTEIFFIILLQIQITFNRYGIVCKMKNLVL